ncbi:uncharacterized protein SPSK_07907 [Sporothrix schenckii 1099-18]|uniref:Hemerythrin-like domain-containing protein n=2 Tax=Sporothrix schenckii TaxID=29908 RepID=U7Q214_SPOS1|nr:uncharacterized protein SPSK_07907 [Sporothrix schenckii 1099-18]ERT01242.1 hypothetical protein HMPREF1624_02484 [Sporothrix schenckii ATCC 58251]KJR88390.1 hypothetical protein SPSK_07907 [Sporothrix schenckii 1099-18]
MSSSSQTPAVAGSSGAEELPDSGSKAPDRTTEEGAVNVDTQEATTAEEEKPQLPPLTPAQFREYNRMAEHMDHFHNHFRQVWNTIYDACEKRKRPAGMSIRQFLDEGLQFINFLTTHHSIEESYVFPMLAKRMPEFQPPTKKKPGAAASNGNAKAALLIQQHREIHAGMDAFEDYVRRCKSGETELEMTVLKAQMDSWGKVLWQHLDEEVAALGAENMRKYWSLEDMRRMRM